MVIINFADMSDDELMKFWLKYSRPSRADAEELVGDRRRYYTNIASTLAASACNIATAHTCSRRGDKVAESIYLNAAALGLRCLPKDVLKRVHLGLEVKQAMKKCHD